MNKMMTVNTRVRFEINGNIYVGCVDEITLNSSYEHGKSYSYNINNGGYTVHIEACTYTNEGKNIRARLELDSSAEDFEIISNKEFSAFIKEHQKPLPNIEMPDFGFGSDEDQQ